MEAVRLISVTFSIFASFNCTNEYFKDNKLLDNYKHTTHVVDICGINKSNIEFDEDLVTKFQQLYGEKCAQEVTKNDCKATMDELIKNFDNVVAQATHESFSFEDRDVIMKNEKCIREKLHEYKIYNNYLYLYIIPGNSIIFESNTRFSDIMVRPITLARDICMGDEIYGTKFEDDVKYMRNLSQIEPCKIQYLIDEGFVVGKLPERPQNCEHKNANNIDDMNNLRSLADGYDFKDFAFLRKNVIRKCFINKLKQYSIIQQLNAIEFSYALQSEKLNLDETKRKSIQLLKLVDKFALECYAQATFNNF